MHHLGPISTRLLRLRFLFFLFSQSEEETNMSDSWITGHQKGRSFALFPNRAVGQARL